MTALALAVTLTWTVPTRTADPCKCGLYVPREARVYRHRQSETWRAMRPAMEAMGEVWEAYWPLVRAEARPVRVASIPLGQGQQGRRMTWSTPDTSATTFWFVTTVDTAGRESRQSNTVGR